MENLDLGKNHEIVHNGIKTPLINNNPVGTSNFNLYFKTIGFTIFKVCPWINKSPQIITYSDKLHTFIGFDKSRVYKDIEIKTIIQPSDMKKRVSETTHYILTMIEGNLLID